MKNIHRNKTKFQNFLDALRYVYLLFFGELPQKQFTPYVFVSPAVAERAKLKNAARRFELKKRFGGITR